MDTNTDGLTDEEKAAVEAGELPTPTTVEDFPEVGIYRSVPKEVEAARWLGPESRDGSATIEVLNAWGCETRIGTDIDNQQIRIFNKTHGDWNLVNPGDWIVKGTQGEFYPVDARTFAERYEFVE